MRSLVLGIDVGGTATRAVAATIDGTIVGRGSAGTANPQVVSPAEVGSALVESTTAALAGANPRSVVAGVVGMAGFAGSAHPEAAAAIAAAWRRSRIDCQMRTVGDVVVAFAAGTAESDGQIVIAGTGAIAATIRHRHIDQAVDGLGWLLGDAGSGYWLGDQAARLTARRLMAGQRSSPLSRAVAQWFGSSEPDGFITACYRNPRQDLAALAPLVCSLVEEDPAARSIVDSAAGRLADSLAALRPVDGPIVLTGGLLSRATPVRQSLQRLLAPRRETIRIGADPAAAAAWLAVLDTGVDEATARRLHRLLCPAVT